MMDFLSELISEHLWSFYFIMGILLSLLEIVTPGLVWLPMGLGALATIPFSFIFPFPITLFLWGGLSGVSYLMIKRFYNKKQRSVLQTGVEGLIGKKGIVTQTINPATEEGKVKIYGDEWRVFGTHELIEQGTYVKILEFRGNRIRVEAKMNTDEDALKKFDEKLQLKD